MNWLNLLTKINIMKKEEFSKEIFLRYVEEISAPDHYLHNESLPDKYLENLYEVLSLASKLLPQSKFEHLIQKKLQMTASEFDEAQYIQNACELSAIADYLNDKKYLVEYEKKITGKKDVDFSLKVEDRAFNVEVKCSSYNGRTTTPEEGQIQVQFLDRAPTKEMKKVILENISQQLNRHSLSISEEKNLDNVLKDFLKSTQGKVKDTLLSETNILLICCNDELDMQQWRHYLFGPSGFFTDKSLIHPSEYNRVDFILLTNLYNRHIRAYEGKIDGNSWSLADAFCLLYPNKFSLRNTKVDDYVAELSKIGEFFPNHSANFESYFANDEVPEGESVSMKRMCLAVGFFSDNLKKNGLSYFKNE